MHVYALLCNLPLNCASRGLCQTGYIDYDKLEEKALDFRPRMIICGGSAYPREWDYARLSAIAGKVGALLMCDMAHYRRAARPRRRKHAASSQISMRVQLGPASCTATQANSSSVAAGNVGRCSCGCWHATSGTPDAVPRCMRSAAVQAR